MYSWAVLRVLDFLLRPPLVAIDVGTATTRVAFGGARVVEQPSVVRETLGRTIVARPVMRGGVVADVEGVSSVVASLLRRERRVWRRRPAAVVCAPSDVSPQEKEALVEAVASGGASVVAVVPEPLAAAIGAGLDLSSEYATAIVDIGEGVTDVAVFRNASMVFSRARRIGCGTLRAAIEEWVALREPAPPPDSDAIESLVRAYCRSDVRALPRGMSRDELETLLDPVLDAIASFVADTLNGLPDAIAAEVIESGVHVTGGGANLQRLVSRIESRARLQLTRPAEPLGAVIRGASAMLRSPRLLQNQV